jgi:hypothetical protein
MKVDEIIEIIPGYLQNRAHPLPPQALQVPLSKFLTRCRAGILLQLGNEHVSLSSACLTDFTFNMSGSIAQGTSFRSIFRIYIGIDHLTITFLIMSTG